MQFLSCQCLHTGALHKAWGPSENTQGAVPSTLEGWAQDEAKHHNTELWSREEFNAGPCKELDGLCPKQPKLPESSQQSPFLVKGREGRVSCCKRLGGRACVPEIRSRSGNDAPVNLQENTCYSLFCDFLSLYKWLPKALRIGYPVFFRL